MLSRVLTEAARRRTFAVISHPDAGKSTLTEALALHASAIDAAGPAHGEGGPQGVTSDWMEMEQKRGISSRRPRAVRCRPRCNSWPAPCTPG